MAITKNLCAQIPVDLHTRISEAREQSGKTTAQYITDLLIEYFEMKENGGNTTMPNNNTRTMAFQIDETLFQRIKAHLERETQRTGRKLTQREFVLGLVEKALDEAERQVRDTQDEVENQPQEDPGEIESPRQEAPGETESQPQGDPNETESQPQEDPDEAENQPGDETDMASNGGFDT